MSEHWASYSAINQHRACPQAYMYDRIRGLERFVPETVKVELEFGLWWHALRAANSIERGRYHGSIIEKLVPKALRPRDEEEWHVPTAQGGSLGWSVLAKANAWWRTLPTEVMEVWAERLGQDLPTRLEYANERYLEEWADDLATERPIAVELGWRRELPALDGVSPDTVLIGYVDEVYLDTSRNLVVVRDHKSQRELKAATVVDDMMESQLQIYSWGAAETLAEHGVGPIRAVAYDRMRMVAPKPPKLTSAGKLAVYQGEPSISASDLTTYLEWAGGPDGQGLPWQGAMLPMTAEEKAREKAGETVERRYKEGGVYRAEEVIIERLSSQATRSKWFQRTLTPLNRNIVSTHLRGAVDTAFDIIETKRRAEATRQAGRNLGGSCRWCDFAKLCRAEMVGGPDEDYDLELMGLRQKD